MLSTWHSAWNKVLKISPLIITYVMVFCFVLNVLPLCSLPRVAEAGSLLWIPYYHHGLDLWL